MPTYAYTGFPPPWPTSSVPIAIDRCIIYGLLTKVKIAGYRPSFLFVFVNQDEFQAHKIAQKRTEPIFSDLEQASLVIKNLLHGL